MRSFSSYVTTLLALDFIEMFVLIDIVKTGITTLNLTTSAANLVVGSTTYLAAGPGSNILLKGFDPLTQTSSVDRASYKIVLADPLFALRASFDIGFIGGSATVRMGFYNTSSGVLNGVAVGLPLTDPNDLITVYKGVIDSNGYLVEDNDVSAILECSSPMASLGLVKSFTTSQDSMKQVATNDTAFDQVYIGSKEVSLLWGKA